MEVICNMNQPAVTRCLSQAMVDVAEWEFNRLRKGMSDVAVARAVEGALKSLDDLRWGIMPSYGDWTALFYLTWHHPNHVNLAYSMIKAMLEKSKRRLPNDLYVLDFGCGTLATQFGLALAIADLRDKQPVKSVRVRPIDDSEPMVRLGKKAWDRFGELAGENADLAALSDAMNSIAITCADDSPARGEERWLSAMHVVYRENCIAVKNGLLYHEKQIIPHVGFITSHDDPNSRSLARSVSPFGDERSYSLHRNLISGVKPLFRGELSPIAQWRRNIERNFLDSPIRENGETFPLIVKRRFLNGTVLWQWRDASCRVYTRVK